MTWSGRLPRACQAIGWAAGRDSDGGSPWFYLRQTDWDWLDAPSRLCVPVALREARSAPIAAGCMRRGCSCGSGTAPVIMVCVPHGVNGWAEHNITDSGL